MQAIITLLCWFLLWSTAWGASGVKVGAIYWPAWSVTTSSDANAQSILSRQESQGKAPWYCTVPYASHISCTESTADMALDIQIAQAAGITYWGFVWYDGRSGSHGPPGNTSLQSSWDLYQASAEISRVNWSIIGISAYLGATTFGSTTTDWHANVDRIVTLMQQSSYQKVLTNRPLIFLLYQASDITTYFNGSLANLGTAIAYLKSQAIAAGLGSPYVVMMGIGTGASAHTTMTTVGADAISSYVVSLRTANAAASKTYATLDSSIQTYWTTLASGGDKTVPILQSGANLAARMRNPPPWEVGNIMPYLGLALSWDVATPGNLADPTKQFTQIGAYIDAHPTIVECNCFIIYSWTEHDEGSPALQPERGDPPQSQPPYTGGASSGLTNILNAVGPILWGYR